MAFLSILVGPTRPMSCCLDVIRSLVPWQLGSIAYPSRLHRCLSSSGHLQLRKDDLAHRAASARLGAFVDPIIILLDLEWVNLAPSGIRSYYSEDSQGCLLFCPMFNQRLRNRIHSEVEGRAPATCNDSLGEHLGPYWTSMNSTVEFCQSLGSCMWTGQQTWLLHLSCSFWYLNLSNHWFIYIFGLHY